MEHSRYTRLFPTIPVTGPILRIIGTQMVHTTATSSSMTNHPALHFISSDVQHAFLGGMVM